MRIKSYFAASVEAAVAQAARELGDDALLLNSRPATAETRHLGAYEVVFGIENEPAPAAATPGEFKAAVPETFADYLASLDLSPALARDIESGCEGDTVSSEQLARELGRRLKVDAAVPRLLALVGPPGAGKTATLLKLALRETFERRRAVAVIGGDSLRVGANETLRSLCALAGIAFEEAASPEAIPALAEARRGSAVFVDTPGFSPAELSRAAAWAAALAKISALETALTLPATMRTSDLSLAASRYRIFRPSRLVFTRLDETVTTGGLVSLAAATQWPLSWFGIGPAVPEDLEDSSAARALAGLPGIELARTAAA